MLATVAKCQTLATVECEWLYYRIHHSLSILPWNLLVARIDQPKFESDNEIRGKKLSTMKERFLIQVSLPECIDFTVTIRRSTSVTYFEYQWSLFQSHCYIVTRHTDTIHEFYTPWEAFFAIELCFWIVALALLEARCCMCACVYFSFEVFDLILHDPSLLGVNTYNLIRWNSVPSMYHETAKWEFCNVLEKQKKYVYINQCWLYHHSRRIDR